MKFQNEGEIDFFTVNKLNNDNDKAENIWTLTSPETRDWAEGQVEVKSDGDLEYQVSHFSFVLTLILLDSNLSSL